MAILITQAEADSLISMLKTTVEQYIILPQTKGSVSFDVVGEKKKDSKFVINIDRKGLDCTGCTYQGRVKQTNQILMRLDVNPTSKHINPGSGEVITGTHLHIFSEQYDMKYAIPFDINNSDLFQTCYTFFEKFNVIKPPSVVYQNSM